MNTFKKIAVVGFLGAISTVSMAPARANPVAAVLMPEISVLTAQLGQRIAAELKMQLAHAIAAPRAPRATRPESVTITEEVVLVVATRLPPAPQTVADAATSNRVRF